MWQHVIENFVVYTEIEIVIQITKNFIQKSIWKRIKCFIAKLKFLT